jgi:hypothetical protein
MENRGRIPLEGVIVTVGKLVVKKPVASDRAKKARGRYEIVKFDRKST